MNTHIEFVYIIYAHFPYSLPPNINIIKFKIILHDIVIF